MEARVAPAGSQLGGNRRAAPARTASPAARSPVEIGIAGLRNGCKCNSFFS